MASSKSEIELSPLPTKDEADGKPDAIAGKPEEEPTIENVIETLFKQFQN